MGSGCRGSFASSRSATASRHGKRKLDDVGGTNGKRRACWCRSQRDAWQSATCSTVWFWRSRWTARRAKKCEIMEVGGWMLVIGENCKICKILPHRTSVAGSLIWPKICKKRRNKTEKVQKIRVNIFIYLEKKFLFIFFWKWAPFALFKHIFWNGQTHIVW